MDRRARAERHGRLDPALTSWRGGDRLRLRGRVRRRRDRERHEAAVGERGKVAGQRASRRDREEAVADDETAFDRWLVGVRVGWLARSAGLRDAARLGRVEADRADELVGRL